MGTAFLFGLIAFLSPCVLPLLPGYFSYIAGTSSQPGAVPDRRLLLVNSTGFVLGFSVLFIGLGAAASGAGQWLNQNRILLTQIGGVIIFVLGLHVSGLLPISFLYRQFGWRPGMGGETGVVKAKMDHGSHLPGSPGRVKSAGPPGWLGAFVLGLSFAAAWTPCVGPVLASILLLAGSTETMLQGVALLTCFALGLALPFMIMAIVAGGIFRILGRLQKLLPYINAVSGGLLMAMGILLLLGAWDKLARLFY